MDDEPEAQTDRDIEEERANRGRKRHRFVRARRPLTTFVLVLLSATTLVVGPRFFALEGIAPLTPVPADVSSADWPADAVVYHVLVDRFADGDEFEDLVLPSDPADALTGWMGGDLGGVRARLGHIAALGANTIWLSPVSPGPYYHGYHPTDLTDVHERFGDVELLRTLVTDAQALGMRVVYDLVLGHTSERHPWFVAAQEDCDGSEFVEYYSFESCPDDYADVRGLAELPRLDLDHPPVRDFVFDHVLPFWLDDIGVDGFRLGNMRGPSREFWDSFRRELDDRWPGTFLLGEVWAGQPTIDSYAEVLDAATAFPLRDRLVAVFARGGDVSVLARPIAARSHAADDSPRPATYLSSHDQPRFAFVAGGDLRRTALAYAAILTMPGMPVIYYGDEVGLSQRADHATDDDFPERWFREPMPWDEDTWDQPMLDLVGALTRLRTRTPALYAGDHLDVLAEGAVWVFERRADDDRVLVTLNISESAVQLDLADLYGGPVDAEVALTDLLADEYAGSAVTRSSGGSLPVTVDALGVGVHRIEGPLPASAPLSR